jgi:hypothetical protein
MDLDATTATALTGAFSPARRHGGAAAALRALGIGLEDVERLEGLSGDLERASSPAAWHGARRSDASSFLMDRDLHRRGDARARRSTDGDAAPDGR